MEDNFINVIKKTTREFFEKMGVSPDILEVFLEEGVFHINLKIEEPKLLIGQEGRVLNDIQKLLAKMLSKDREERFFLDLDINEYKKKKYSYLKELANAIADEVSISKEERELDPMPAYQRRIIHLELAKRKDVLTESVGEEPRRRVVVRPAKK